ALVLVLDLGPLLVGLLAERHQPVVSAREGDPDDQENDDQDGKAPEADLPHSLPPLDSRAGFYRSRGGSPAAGGQPFEHGRRQECFQSSALAAGPLDARDRRLFQRDLGPAGRDETADQNAQVRLVADEEHIPVDPRAVELVEDLAGVPFGRQGVRLVDVPLEAEPARGFLGGLTGAAEGRAPDGPDLRLEACQPSPDRGRAAQAVLRELPVPVAPRGGAVLGGGVAEDPEVHRESIAWERSPTNDLPPASFSGVSFSRLSLESGDRVGPYEIIEPLGKGGMGEVYRAK